MEEIRLRPWAKINLCLEVLGKGNNGYHQIRTLIQPIALFDELSLKRVPQGLQLDCKTEDSLPGKENLPLPSQNLVAKAAELFFSIIGESPKVKISLVKHIPIGGGLGGGSSDAASTLVGLNKLWGYPLEDRALLQLASQLGMDIPCFLEPKSTICTGRGEIIEQRLENKRGLKFWCVLVNPGKGLSTASVYKELSLSLTESSSKDNILFFSKQPCNNIYDIIYYIRNDLEDAAIRLYPELFDIINILHKTGVLKSFVCGSGSTVCGLLANRAEAEEVMEKVSKEKGSRDWWMRAVSSL